MGEDTRSNSRIQFHKQSRARNYRRKPNNIVRSFYLEKLSSFSYVNPEDPSHGYNLRSLGQRNSALNTSAIATDMDQMALVSLADVVALLSEKADPLGLSVRQIRDKLIRRRKITEKATDEQVREALQKGIKKRRIKKVAVNDNDEHSRSRSRSGSRPGRSNSGELVSEASRTYKEEDDELYSKSGQDAGKRSGGGCSETRSESRQASRSLSGSRKSERKCLQSSGKDKSRTGGRSRSRSKGRSERPTSRKSGLKRSKSHGQRLDRYRHRGHDGRSGRHHHSRRRSRHN